MKTPMLVLPIPVSVAVACWAVHPTEAKAAGGNVKIPALGTHTGEVCRRDRAMLFEDPNGTTLLFDAGRSVLGPSDPRLGKVDVVLLSSVHGDHIGDRIPPELNAGT